MYLKRDETNTVLAALRAYQLKGGEPSATPVIRNIATNECRERSLSVEEIDTLCERLNHGHENRDFQLALELIQDFMAYVDNGTTVDAEDDPLGIAERARPLLKLYGVSTSA